MTRFLLLALGALALRPALSLAQTTPAAPTPPSTAWTDRSRALPDELRRLPVGLTLRHSPGVIYPEPNPAVPGGYVWKHSTAVRAEDADLEIVTCGSYIWYSAAGWQTNLHETPAEFAELFNCPGGKLKKGVTYTFARNYRYAASAKSLYGGDALWFIIAKDAQGRLYKGYGLIETEAAPQAVK
ncbi:hypothetical protein [Hymenobacter crusticola]|uniref:Uncharacterized protein n=1 Tax=Hymenobacter crusticola TaxID=1770526 RepID=A0A243W841_9BACT|nr:hypothetical protein [Hymenobacter crusticola]OUJ70029.1 hypothetical protein BXP70_25495 [Hymenobacter crusticola]